MNQNLRYYLWATYRRKSIDKYLSKYTDYYRGIVLDIGGKDRGKFVKPKANVEKWIFADIEEKNDPDIILDVSDMGKIKDETIDVINAIELFEHVESPEEGLKECYRVLKIGGHMLISVPFLFPVHGDPFDFQRWTDKKWYAILRKIGFKIIKLEKMGLFFSVLSDMLKMILRSLPIIKYFIFLYPILDILQRLDDTKFAKENIPFKDYVQGYFIILEK